MSNYFSIKIDDDEAVAIAKSLYGLDTDAKALDGEIDFNFKVKSGILKVSRPNPDLAYLRFQNDLLIHLEEKKLDVPTPRVHHSKDGDILTYIDRAERARAVRLLSWTDGTLYSSLRSKSPQLLLSLGQTCGTISHALLDFNHDYAHRKFDWDIAQIDWVFDHLLLFQNEKFNIINYFLNLYIKLKPSFLQLRKSVVHNDANDNNIIVNPHGHEYLVSTIIDYGDAIYSYTITDLAVAIAYGVMDTSHPLEAAMQITKGYHKVLPLNKEECSILYTAVALRLIISVTKAAINRTKEPDNEYLQISDRPAWQLLEYWMKCSPSFAESCFRSVCDFTPCIYHEAFVKYATQHKIAITDVVKLDQGVKIEPLDLAIDSVFLENFSAYRHSERYSDKIYALTKDNDILLVGGYGEARPIYTTDAYKVATLKGYEHRTMHMGVDFWCKAGTEVGAIDQGEIVSIYDNGQNKDYGPTIIIKHENNVCVYYSLYGHLSETSLKLKQVGDYVSQGELIGYIGHQNENGNWAPHLHFQLILDMLGCIQDFFGVAQPSLWAVYSSICPDPNLLFKISQLKPTEKINQSTLLNFRKNHLGKSLSVSYDEPLTILRGEMQYLLNEMGQKYTDTVNNVAHVGHENPDVLAVAISQMHLLNTNTRYLHHEINAFAELLVSTFHPSLSVVHFVNSGSEANELALRMARTYTGRYDMVALEDGYHGNTQACIDVSSYKFDGKGGGGKPLHTHLVPLPDVFRGIYQGEGAGELYANHVKKCIEELRQLDKGIAGFIAESIVSCGGQIPLPKNFLKLAYQYVREAGGLCIADEVQVGLGRVGKSFWGYELCDEVVPDIVTIGKPIGNGHPLGAVVCTQAVADRFANGMEYFNTFGGNPVSCAMGRSVLKYTLDHNLMAHAHDMGQLFKEGFLKLKVKYPIIADIRGEGLFLGIEFCDQDKRPLPSITSYIVNQMKEYKILMSIDGPDHNVIKIKPPMIIQAHDIEYIMTFMEKCLVSTSMTQLW